MTKQQCLDVEFWEQQLIKGLGISDTVANSKEAQELGASIKKIIELEKKGRQKYFATVIEQVKKTYLQYKRNVRSILARPKYLRLPAEKSVVIETFLKDTNLTGFELELMLLAFEDVMNKREYE